MAVVEIFYKQHSDVVTDNFKSFLENETYIDLIFMCRNNRKVGAHQMVMGCLSKFLSDLLVQNQIEAKDKIIYVYVPDIRAKIMKSILQFVYTGKVMINRDELGELNDDLILLGMPLSVITSVDKRQLSAPVNQNPQMPPHPIPQTAQGTPMENVSNFGRPPSNSGIAISGITSLSSDTFQSTNASSSKYGSPYNEIYTLAAAHNISSNATGLASIPPSSTSGAQFSAELITRPTQPSTTTPMKSHPNDTSSTPKKTSKSGPTPQKREKSLRGNGSKRQKNSSDQCINLADDDDDDIITIS